MNKGQNVKKRNPRRKEYCSNNNLNKSIGLSAKVRPVNIRIKDLNDPRKCTLVFMMI